jgi:hypothetical protein
MNVDQHAGELDFRNRAWVVVYDGKREVARQRWLLTEGDIADFIRTNRPPAQSR